MKRLGDIATIITGNTPKKSEPRNYESLDIPFIKPSDISNFEISYLDGAEHYLSEFARNKAKVVPLGSILVTCIGIIGKVAVSKVECAFNQQINAIIVKENIALPMYLAYVLQYKKPYLQEIANAPVVPILNKTQFSNVEIKLPDLRIQEKIVNKLDLLTSLIEKQNQQLEKLDELVKARFVEMFGDPILNPKGWEYQKLGDICDVRDGTHDSPCYIPAGYPLVTSKNITGGEINLTSCSFISKIDYEKINLRSKVDIGDILMPMIGTIGNPVIVAIQPKFAIKNVALIKFKKHSLVLNTYIKILLESDYFCRSILKKAKGGTQKFISLSEIRSLDILLPPISLQNQFADFVEQVEKEKANVKASLEKLETLKKSLMQEYFG